MKKHIALFISLCLAFSLQAQVLPNFGGERAGLSTLSFLKNDLNPRSVALGGASVSLSGDGYSVLSNPAALTDIENTTLSLSHLVIGAGIHQSLASFALPLNNKVSALALSVNSLNSGEMEERTEFQPTGTGRKVFVSHMASSLTYSRKLSSVFNAAVSLKYIYESMAEFTNHYMAVDVGFLYKTDFKDLKFAVMVQNFGGNSTLSKNEDIPVLFNRDTGINLGANTVPTVFSLGLSLVPFKQEKQSLMAAVQLNHPNDNAENLRFGLEYELRELFYARAGYKLSVAHQSYPTFGVGIRTRVGAHPLMFDYSINPTQYMGFQQSIGLRLALNNDSRSEER